MLQELNILNKIFQIKNADLSQLGAQIELTTRSLTRMFLDAENFASDSKYVKTFMDVAQNGTIEYSLYRIKDAPCMVSFCIYRGLLEQVPTYDTIVAGGIDSPCKQS